MIPKRHRALSYGALAPGARFPTKLEQEVRAWLEARGAKEWRYVRRPRRP